MNKPSIHDLEKPLTITKFVTHRTPAWRSRLLFGGQCGDMVAIRPCAKQFEDRTYLGILLGEIAQIVKIGSRQDELHYDMAMHNPAILIPELNEVIFGNASWWGLISSPDQMRDITNDDISNVWYVKALEQIEKFAAEDAADDASCDEPTTSGSA